MASFSAKAGALSHGESFAAVVARLDEVPNVIAVGINCSAPDIIAPLLRSAAPKRVLLAASPNAGETWDATSRQWTGTPYRGESFGALARSYVEAGARIVGGCCRTRPADIAAARLVL